MRVMQSYNNKTKAWVKYKKLKNGRTVIMNVKQSDPTKPFKGIPKR